MSPDETDLHASGEVDANPNAGVPRQKRLACLICRRRKLKCDGRRPSCSTCTRLSHQCEYDEVRKKSGPKRGYVKALEERLKQVEVMLKSKDGKPAPAPPGHTRGYITDTGVAANHAHSLAGALGRPAQHAVPHPGVMGGGSSRGGVAPTNGRDFSIPNASMLNMPPGHDSWNFNSESSPPRSSLDDQLNFAGRMPSGDAMDASSTWEIIQLNLEEPLPQQNIIDDLNRIYFDKVHPSMPMVHRGRYYSAMNLPCPQRPPVCLRYAMWMSACAVTDQYYDLKDLFYQRARKYLEVDYMKGFGEHMISVAHCQTHVILASYEFKMMYFPRAWMNTGQAVRLAQMIGLHRLDGAGLEVKQCIPEPRDWTEKEERRRTFWMAFCEDRYASIGTGWPMCVDERDITTVLPCSEEAFDMSRNEPGIPLNEAMCPSGVGQLTPFSGIVLMACLFGRNLTHLYRPDTDGRDDDLNGEYWKRHRNLDNVLLNTQLGLPVQLKLTEGGSNPNVVFTNMCIYTSTICLHQAAILKAEKNGLESSVSPESKYRCFNAAKEIAKIMRMVSHLDLSAMNPFISFCLYVAARVLVQLLKFKPKESQAISDVRFLLTAMNALKRRNPLTESFLVQLDVDLEALGDCIPELKQSFPMSSDSPASAAGARPGAVCDEGAVDGILSYQREFSKTGESSQNSDGAGDDNSSRERISESSSAGANSGSNNGRNGSSTASSITNQSTNQQWAINKQQLEKARQGATQPIPLRDRTGGHAAMYHVNPNAFADNGVAPILTGGRQSGMVYGDDVPELTASPGSGASNRPTPNSSTVSETTQNPSQSQNNPNPNQNLVPPQGGNIQSNRGHYNASPVSASGALGTGQQQQTTTNHVNGFYGSASAATGPMGYSSGGGSAGNAAALPMTSSSGGIGGMMAGGASANNYMVPNSWDMGQGGTGMAPVTEGMLQSMMHLSGPMDNMGMGWGSNQ